MPKDKYRAPFRPWFFGVAVAITGMVVSLMLARQQANSMDRVGQARFAQAANGVTESLIRRINAYTEIAFGVRGLFIVNPELDRASFMKAVSQLNAVARYPGIKNIAFTRYVTAAEKHSFEERVRADTALDPKGYPGFAIHPAGERPEYFVADYLWPATGNKGIHGLDISAQPANLASMRYSQQSGQPVASAPFDLIQERTHATGFVIRVPVFRTLAGTAATQQRRLSNFLGSVAVTVRIFDLIEQMLQDEHLQGVQLQLTDQGSSIVSTPASAGVPMFSSMSTGVGFSSLYRREMNVLGRNWQLDFVPERPFLSAAERSAPLVIGLTGTFISLLLGTLVMLLARSRSLALAQVASTDAALKDSEERWKFALEGAGDGVWDWNLKNGDIYYSPRWKSMLGLAPDDIGNQPDEWLRRIHPEDLSQVMAALDPKLDALTDYTSVKFRMQCKDTSWKWVHLRGKVQSLDANGQPLRLIGTMTDITEQKLAEDEINHLAFYDPLTHLPNRRLLYDRLQQAIAVCARTGHHSALLFIDLDNFKTLNDSLGHYKGDLLLQQVAQRLSDCLREGDTVARLGGDEFVVILKDLGSAAQEAANRAESIGVKIIATLNAVYDLGGLEHHSTSSLGVTLFSDHSDTIQELLKRADLAMYQAKSAGRNTLRFFDPHMQAVVSARVALEANLREGLRLQQFLLHYQAQTSDGRIVGAEALLRWQHPERGFVSPVEFIALAEETGLILPLGQWVLRTACRQLAAWSTDPSMAELTIAVNVSARQFRQTDFVSQVLTTLAATGARPGRLKLELTESLLLDHVDEAIVTMERLKAHGVSFSLDDFGTGYSSLSYLKRLPLGQLKTDQSFMRDVLTDLNDAAIVRAIITLGQSLSLDVIAEGVETVGQRDFLALSGCHTFQGYLFHRPGPAEHLRNAMLAGGPRFDSE